MVLNLDAVGTVLGPETFEYDEDRVILYALGIGVPPEELEFLYERGLKVIPTFSVVTTRLGNLGTYDLLNISLTKLLHGENRIEVYQPLPPRARFTATNTVKAIYDKGKGAVVITEIEAKDEAGKPLFKNISSSFVRGEGGFGGDRGPTGPRNEPPARPPDKTVTFKTAENQAQIYRLSGDKNPLHVDPEFARQAGFERPILHGLCTYGHVGRAVMKACAGNDPARLRMLEVRFSDVVYPGQSITTEIWDGGGGKLILQAKTEDGRKVISNGAAELS